jgi:hypothetical protein
MGRAMRTSIWLLWLGLVGGCSDGPGTQYRPIGSDCSSSDQCGTRPFSCVTAGYPHGYCQKDCATDGDCPSDSVCVAPQCRRKCHTSTDCRTAEGYVCRADGPSQVCDLPANADGGTP